MQKVIQLELNEVNFDFVKAYCAQGRLPNLNRLIALHGVTETMSETRYDTLEPWIQWVSAHTGLSYADHGVYRLGDIMQREDLPQIWETIEQAGYSVGAISPMNARNACVGPSFFLPDPWTRSSVTGSPLLHRLNSAVGQIVNDNAQSRVQKSSLAWLGIGLARFAKRSNYRRYASLVLSARRKSWTRALLLDLLLADIFVGEVRRSGADFSTLFLNAAAHIQHHYMFNASVYEGPHRNPDWYVDPQADPVLEVYELYDVLLGQIERNFPDHRLLIATGLHQDPYPDLLYYWRLRQHDEFIREIGVPHVRVEPRMSRDFVVYCADAAEANEAERILSAVRADDGLPLFEVDNRGDSLFVMLTYPAAISPELGFSVGNRHFADLAGKTVFVAIKNGEHNGIGYLIDTDAQKGADNAPVSITNLFDITKDHFGLEKAIGLAG